MVGINTLVEQSSGRVVTARQLAHVSPAHGVLSVLDPLARMLPHGVLQRGRLYACTGIAATSLAVSLAARATQEGSWLALVDAPHIGYASARDYGVALQRVVSVDAHDTGSHWSRVIGSIIDGFDIVITGAINCSAAETRRVMSRLQSQSGVLIVIGMPAHVTPDVVLNSTAATWHFTSRAEAREVQVSCHGRRVHAGTTQRLLLPSSHGVVATSES